mmetsp:Transcript_56322/g.104169  ORF Transcript_56322/g.104169 Transcript_56322/m.104169 type:complete len:210 (-) Transcript_56322:2652-3281(-)
MVLNNTTLQAVELAMRAHCCYNHDGANLDASAQRWWGVEVAALCTLHGSLIGKCHYNACEVLRIFDGFSSPKLHERLCRLLLQEPRPIFLCQQLGLRWWSISCAGVFPASLGECLQAPRYPPHSSYSIGPYSLPRFHKSLSPIEGGACRWDSLLKQVPQEVSVRHASLGRCLLFEPIYSFLQERTYEPFANCADSGRMEGQRSCGLIDI